MIRLNSNRLQIEIAEPGEAPDDTDRFDRSGYITEIVLDKRHRFCASEPNNLVHPCSGGRGLCNEFVTDLCDQTKIGEYFPKFGIGLFVKPDDKPYCFHRKYDKREFPIRFEKNDHSVCFITDPIDCQGYALKNTKMLEVNENVLTMTVMVENTGDKALELNEYCHNFISIDGMALGPGYKIMMPDITDRGHDIICGTIKGDGNGYTFSGFNPKAAEIEIDPNDIKSETRFQWSLANTDAGAIVNVTDYFKPSSLSIWSIDHIISVESFNTVLIQPGQKEQWKRSWSFNELEKKHV